MAAQPHRRLSTRRGSTSALDPYALHADINENPNRTSSSKLTIVRVLPQQPPPTQPVTLNEAPSSRRRRLGSLTGPHSSPAAESPRLSFAFSSFGSSDGVHSNDRTHGGPASPTSSPRMRPSSPRLSAAGAPSNFSIGKARLTPDQLVDLARQATNPRTLAQIASSTAPSSPVPHSSGGHSVGNSPVLRPQSIHLPNNVSTNTMPATFTPLPDDIFLPFVDRPSEVAQLISTPPDAKLFALLAQTLPKIYTEADGGSSDDPNAVHLPKDPSVWTYSHLIYHLTELDRDVVPDPIWAFAARRCILSHSELIWERVKGALGIPPELDLDYDFTRTRRRSSQEKRDARMRKFRMQLREGAPKHRLGQGGAAANESAIEDDEESVGSSDISDDEEDQGYWPDWEAALDPPVRPRTQSKIPTGPNSGISRKDSVHDVGGIVIGSFNNPTSSIDIATQGPSPRLTATSIDDDDSDFISIEALLTPSPEMTGALGSNPPPPLSLAASALLGTGAAADTPAAEGMGLGDIAEGEEDEDEGGAEDSSKKEPEEEELIAPSQIQGLRIMTNPVHAAGSYGVGGLFMPHHPHPLPGGSTSGGDGSVISSPLPISPTDGDEKTEARTLAQALGKGESSGSGGPNFMISPPLGGRGAHSRTSSFSSVTGVTIGPFSRSESTGNLAALIAAQNQYQQQHQFQHHQQQHHSGSEAGDSAGYGSDWSTTGSAGALTPQVELVGDRSPGQPLFVSNFARLNGCPTLKGTSGGNNPVGRSNPSRFKLKRTGSTGGGVVGSVPSSNFLGSHAVGKTGSPEARVRTYSHGSHA